MINRKNSKLQNVTNQLNLQVQDTESDRQELQKILFQVLEYPSLQKAERHHLANKIGKSDLLTSQKQMEKKIMRNETDDIDVCQCCGMILNYQSLPFCTKLSQIKMGVGVHLFFNNYFFHIIIFTLMFLIYSIYALVTNLQEGKSGSQLQREYLCLLDNDEEEQGHIPCEISLMGAGSKLVFQNKSKNLMSRIQAWIGFGFVIIWGMIFFIKTYLDDKMIAKLNSQKISARDFTLMIRNMPRQYLDKPYEEAFSKLNQIFQQYGKDFESEYSYEIVKFNIAKPLYYDEQNRKKFSLRERKQLDSKTQPFRRLIKERQSSKQFSIPQEERMKMFEDYEEYYNTKQKYEIGEKITLSEQNLIFVTFKSSKAREEIQLRNQKPTWRNVWNYFFKTDFPIPGLKIQPAPEPQEIIWENVGFPTIKKYIRRFGLAIVTVILVAISLAISLGISKFNQNQLPQEIAIMVSIVVTISNTVIKVIIMFLSQAEHEQISSIEQTSIAVKIGFGQLANSIGVPILVTAIINNSESFEDRSWLTAGGLVDSVFYISFFNIFIPFSRLINPKQILNKIRRKLVQNPKIRLRIHGQRQMNKLYGNNQFKIGYEYSYLIKTAIYTSFFVCLQPIIAIFAPIGLLLFYLIEKRNLLRHFTRPQFNSSKINKNVDFILLICLLAFGFGSFTVNNLLQELYESDNGTLPIDWAIIMMGIIFWILIPFKVFHNCLKEPEKEEMFYNEKKPFLSTDYDRLNPITKQSELSKFLNQLNILQNQHELPQSSCYLKMLQQRKKKSIDEYKSISFRKLTSMKKMKEKHENMDSACTKKHLSYDI